MLLLRIALPFRTISTRLRPFSNGVRSMSQYKYAALPSANSIRLLQLNPERFASEPLQCQLKTTELKEASPFLALSYTWAAPEELPNNSDAASDTKSHSIVIDQQTVSVTANLHSALKVLRQAVERGTLLWIDAICINQDNLAEKSSQVNMMGEIYHSASRVLIWLGDDIRGDGKAGVLGIRQLTVSLAQLESDPAINFENTPRARNSYDLYTEEFLARVCLPLWIRDHWLAIARVFERRWFMRAWCVQEVLLVKQRKNILVMLGTTIFSWYELVQASSFLLATGLCKSLGTSFRAPGLQRSDHSIGWEPISMESTAQHLNSNSSDNDWTRGICNTIGQGPDELNAAGLLHALLVLLPRAATDPRDIVYAYLGILNHTCKTKSLELTSLKADYSKPVEDVLTSTAQFIMEQTQKLNFLYLVRSNDCHDATLPSWARAFSSMRHETLGECPEYDCLQDSRHTKAAFHFEQNLLHVRGARVGTISQFSATGEQMVVHCDLKDCFKTILGLPEVGKTGQSRIEMFWRTIIGNRSLRPDTFPAPAHVALDFANWLNYLLARRKLIDVTRKERSESYEELLDMLNELVSSDPMHSICNPEVVKTLISTCGVHSKSFDEATNLILKQIPSLDDSFKNIEVVLPGRRLFRTIETDLGLGPADMQPGDTVWLLEGLRVPMVLRSASSDRDCSYNIIGEAYLHDWMTGAALQTNSLTWKALKLS